MAIVVSHIGARFDALCQQALRQAPLADLIELRLDRIGNPGVDALRAFAKSAKKPVIAACHGPEAGGEFTGSDAERLEVLRAAAAAGCGFVDVDWSLALDLGSLPGKCHRIVSRHDLEGTPGDLGSFAEEARAVMGEGDVLKVVPRARSAEDGLRVLEFVRGQKGMVGFASGEEGSFTRVLAPIFGSPFTYAAPAVLPGRPEPEASAPGQIRVNDLRAALPPGGATQETAVLGVVGRGVRHSFSPHVHGMALRAARLDAVYAAFEPRDFGAFLGLCTAENFRGFTVLAPFKEDAFRAAAERDGAASSARAANTLVRDGQRWRAANTDVPAVRETLDRAFQIHGREPGRPVALGAAAVLVLGTGGAARAAAWAAKSSGARVRVAGRSGEKASAVARELGCEAMAWSEIPGFEYDVLIHATPLGSLAHPGVLPIAEEWIRPGTLVLDAVYRPIRTPLLLAARKRGCTAVPGGEWFVRQAREQYRLFTRGDPDDQVLRAAFENALAADG